MNNEREKFEAWFVRNIPDDIRDNALLALRQSEREDGNYRQPIMQAFWEGWQARAASASETGAEGATEDHECVYENGDGTCRQCAELAKRAKQRFGYARKIDYRVTGQEPDDHELCSSDAPGAFPLYRSPAMAVEAVAIPAGWKLVPIEPTEEMITAGIAKGDAEFYGDALVRAEVRSDYRAMVAAYVPPLEERGPCICQEDLGNPGGTCAWKNGHAPCAAPQPAQADARIDVEAMLRDCVPGGSICDPQRIADSIREWFDEHGPQADARVGLTDEQIDHAANCCFVQSDSLTRHQWQSFARRIEALALLNGANHG